MIRLSDRVRLVRANNPSPMTLEGTNTYLVGDGSILVIDPGPDDADHLDAVRRAIGDARVAVILLTHRHHDHSEAARSFAAAFDAQVAAFGGPDYLAEVPISDRTRIGGGGTFVTAVHTPGHASDHLCFVLEDEDVVFSGDHVLGHGTTIVAFPDGNMAAYMSSLDKIRSLNPARIFPGHGPIIDDPAGVLAEYVKHRLMREGQILDALQHGPGTPMDLVKRIYTDVDPALHTAAEYNVRAHLDKLADEKRAVVEGEIWSILR